MAGVMRTAESSLDAGMNEHRGDIAAVKIS